MNLSLLLKVIYFCIYLGVLNGFYFWFGSHRAGCMRRPSFWNATEAQVGGWRNTRAKIRREYHSAGLRLHDNLTAVLFFSVETWMRGALLWLRFAVRQNYTAGSKKKKKKLQICLHNPRHHQVPYTRLLLRWQSKWGMLATHEKSTRIG